MDAHAPPVGVVVIDGSPAFVAAASDFIERLGGYTPVRSGVVLLDLGLGGLELAQRVKQGDPARSVIGLALFPTPELIAEATRVGVDAVVSKEAFAEQLPDVLRRLASPR